MTYIQEITKNNLQSVGVAKTPEALSAIYQPNCAAAIWHREPLATFQTWIDALEPEQLPRARLILPRFKVRDAAFELCETYGMHNCTERNRFVDDIAALAEIFGDLMHVSYLQMRLDVVTTNACRKFHVDAVKARLVCTYRGTGTQYALPVDANEPDEVFTVPTGAPILLRGTLWPNETETGVLHRSPPIEGTGETRLVLVLDPVDEPDEKSSRTLLH